MPEPGPKTARRRWWHRYRVTMQGATGQMLGDVYTTTEMGAWLQHAAWGFASAAMAPWVRLEVQRLK